MRAHTTHTFNIHTTNRTYVIDFVRIAFGLGEELEDGQMSTLRRQIQGRASLLSNSQIFRKTLLEMH